VVHEPTAKFLGLEVAPARVEPPPPEPEEPEEPAEPAEPAEGAEGSAEVTEAAAAETEGKSDGGAA
jgi:hypothetical protein